MGTRAGVWHRHTRVQGHLVPVPTQRDPPRTLWDCRGPGKAGGVPDIGGGDPQHCHTEAQVSCAETPPALAAALPHLRLGTGNLCPPRPALLAPPTVPPPWPVQMGTCGPGALGDQGPAAAWGVTWAAPMSLGMLPAKAICSQQSPGGSGHLSLPLPEPGTQHPSEHPGWGHPDPPETLSREPGGQRHGIETEDARRAPGAPPGAGI